MWPRRCENLYFERLRERERVCVCVGRANISRIGNKRLQWQKGRVGVGLEVRGWRDGKDLDVGFSSLFHRRLENLYRGTLFSNVM